MILIISFSLYPSHLIVLPRATGTHTGPYNQLSTVLEIPQQVCIQSFETWSACGRHTGARAEAHTSALSRSQRTPCSVSCSSQMAHDVVQAAEPMSSGGSGHNAQDKACTCCDRRADGASRPAKENIANPSSHDCLCRFTMNARVLYHEAARPREVIAAPFLRCFEVRPRAGVGRIP